MAVRTTVLSPTERRAESSKPTVSHTRFAGRRQIQQKLARARYAMGSGPVYWIGPAAKTGQQLVGQIGDNPCMVSHFGARDNAETAEFRVEWPSYPPSTRRCNRDSDGLISWRNGAALSAAVGSMNEYGV